jgi:broad specificity phosphatase PhoE
LFVFARHAESTANAAGVLSSDPDRHVGLTERGERQARALGAQLAGIAIDVAVATHFLRTKETVALALAGRGVPVVVEPGFDEIQAGEYDGAPIDAYRTWEQRHAGSEHPDRGEAVDEARLRLAAGLRRLLSRTEPITLVIAHSFTIRQLADAASGAAGASFDNAAPYLFDDAALSRAAARLEASAPTAQPEQP